jgi:chemotaxis signal transduction protein
VLLLFQHNGIAYGVPARSVDAVVAWRKPARLPASVPGVAGVVQDRGRVIAVLASPLGESTDDRGTHRRMVICTTRRGFLGLPCDETRQIGTVTLAQEPAAGEAVDSSSGPLVYVDPDVLAESLGRS